MTFLETEKLGEKEHGKIHSQDSCGSQTKCQWIGSPKGRGVCNGPGEFEDGVEFPREGDNSDNFYMSAGNSTNTITGIMEKDLGSDARERFEKELCNVVNEKTGLDGTNASAHGLICRK